MLSSIHDLVPPEMVALRAGTTPDVAAVVLAAQRRAAAMVRAANQVVALPEVVLRHQGDPLGQWCETSGDLLSDEVISAAKEALAADPTLLIGTTLCRCAGCPEALLVDREVRLLEDLAVVVDTAIERDPAIEPDVVNRVLDAFWDSARSVGDWSWPYERVAMEPEIEEWLVDHLDELEVFGIHAVLAEPRPGVSGRQWRSASGADRLDLLLEITADGSTVGVSDGEEVVLSFERGDLVVVELKAVPLAAADVEQIERYLRAVEDEVADGRVVWGLLIGAGSEASLGSALDASSHPRLATLHLSQIGFTRHLLNIPTGDVGTI